MRMNQLGSNNRRMTTMSEGQGVGTRMEFWREAVLAADAKKARSASEAALLIPIPPSLTGRLACNH